MKRVYDIIIYGGAITESSSEQLWGRGIRYGVGSGIGSQDVSLAEQARDGLTPVLRAEGPQPDLQPRAMQAHDDDVAEIVVTAMDEAASMDNHSPF